jgi:CDP-4-dehydro-6-deoxyglucose reductase, E1
MKRIPLNFPTFGDEEINAAIEVLRSTYVTMGRKCQEFEQAFAEFMGIEEAVFVNSGSSANLLVFFALANHAAPQSRGKRRFVSGSEVIVPAVSWSTTFWPIVQAGGIPVFVDCDPHTLQMKPDAMRAALSDKTVAVCPVHVLGNTVQIEEVLAFAAENDLWIVEDTCEALGARYAGKLAGTFGDTATFSFFFSHHITTVEGGMIITHNEELAELLRCLRAHGWTRDLKGRQQKEALYPEIDPDYLFINTGFNLRPTEINAVFGLIQLRKLSAFNQRRNEIASVWNARFLPLIERGIFYPMRPVERADPAWFGYPVICRDQRTRRTLKQHLSEYNIESRPIICGNMARQPALAHIPHRISGNLDGADKIMECGLLWGLSPAMSDQDLEYITNVILEFSPSI